MLLFSELADTKVLAYKTATGNSQLMTSRSLFVTSQEVATKSKQTARPHTVIVGSLIHTIAGFETSRCVKEKEAQ